MLELWRSPSAATESLLKVVPDIRQPGDIRAVAFSPDQKYLAIAAGPQVAILIERPSPGGYRALTPFTERFEQSVEGIAFGSTSQYLAVASADKTVRVWDVGSRQEVNRFFHASGVNAVTFVGTSAIATGQVDGTVSVLDLVPARLRLERQTPEELGQMVCRRVGRSLRAAEWALYFKEERPQSSCPDIGLDPRDLLDYHIAAASDGNAVEARETLRQINASTQKVLLDPTRLLDAATEHAMVDNRGFARNFFQLAAQLAVSESAPAAVLNDVCWRGAIFDYPREVLPACERGVRLTGLFGYHDSRGLALALIGQDMAQALRDFEKYVAEGTGNRDPERIKLREAWIRDLNRGHNPFANDRSVTLEKLRLQSPELPLVSGFKRLQSN
jgi:hypothetical protein